MLCFLNVGHVTVGAVTLDGLNLQKSANDFIRKEFLNTDVKNTFECFKVLLNYVKKIHSGAQNPAKFRTTSRIWRQEHCIQFFTVWCRFGFYLTHRT